MRVHIVVCFKGTVSLARLAKYCVLQAVMRGDGKAVGSGWSGG